MKRFLDKQRYELSDWEKNEIWRGVNGRPTTGSHWTGGALLPALAMTAAVLVVALGISWWQGGRIRVPEVPMLEQTPSARLVDRASDPVVAYDSRSESLEESVAVAEREVARTEVAPPPASSMRIPVGGQLRDAETGEPLNQANIRIAGTNLGLVSGADGRFDLGELPPGQELHLEISYLGYDPVSEHVAVPDSGQVALQIAMHMTIVEELEAFDVEGAEYMVEVKNSATEHTVSSETFQKYAIDSVEDALAKQAGVVSRAGQLYERGGRAKDEKLDMDQSAVGRIRRQAAAPAEVPASGSVTGGTTPPNGEPYELMYFQHTGVNPFVATEDDALSTFAIDVDNASWAVARRYLDAGHLPPSDAIRVEEFVNSFEAGWPEQTEQPLAIHADGAPSRFGSGYHLLRVGLVGQHIDASARKAANLVFVVDVSGSMRQENRLGAVRHSLTILLDELTEGDRVGIVVYGSRGEVRLRPTDISQREVIQAAIDGLVPAGSTNCYEGLKLAYDMARGSYQADVLNRLILCSDGVANNGASTEAEGILELVRGAADEGITLSTVGFGMGNYNDILMEKLADKGDGNYAYVDRKEEAERVFRENLTGMLQTVARETKVQVEFDPRRVDRWRLLGYENRDIADRDFRNDDVDAGEVGVDHRVTALYEVKLTDVDDGIVPPGSLGTVRLRWEAPAHDTARAGQVTEIEREITAADLAGDFAEADLRLRVQAVVAEFAEILRESYWAKESTLADLVPVADGLAADLPGDAQVQELARLIRLAASLEGE